jgi:hypothetical protein
MPSARSFCCFLITKIKEPVIVPAASVLGRDIHPLIR